MHSTKRRLSLLIGTSVLALAAIFPASVAAAQVTPARGEHVWTGTTCAGNTVSVAYHVGRRGRIVIDDIDGGRARVMRSWFFVSVRFRGTTTRVTIRTAMRHGTLRLFENATNGHCSPPPADPPSGDPPPSSDPGNDSPPG
jgi:hypothetical protein